MATRGSREQLAASKLYSAASRLRGAIWQSPAEIIAKQRAELPAVWDAIEGVTSKLPDPHEPAPLPFQPDRAGEGGT